MILVGFPAIALAQKKQPVVPQPTAQQPAVEQPPDYARRASSWVNLNLKFKGDEWHSGNEAIESILNGLLKQVQPEAVAAEVLKCPVDKIVMVPRIFWSESKWVDWAEKVNREQGA